MHAKYEVVLGSEAIRAIRDLPRPSRRELRSALAKELVDGPNAHSEHEFDYGKARYLVTPLSFNAYLALHRPLTGEELARLSEQLGRMVAPHGFYVIAFCSAVPALVARLRD
jgi:hypothetical protein